MLAHRNPWELVFCHSNKIPTSQGKKLRWLIVLKLSDHALSPQWPSASWEECGLEEAEPATRDFKAHITSKW